MEIIFKGTKNNHTVSTDREVFTIIKEKP